MLRLEPQHHHDESHADVLAVGGLIEVAGAGIVVHIHGDLVDTGQGMENGHVWLGVLELFRVEDVGILQADVVRLVEEALLLHPGHVQEVQLGQGILQAGGLLIGQAVLFQRVFNEVTGQLQLVRGDEHEADAMIARQGVHQRVNGAAKFQVAAEADGEVVQTAAFPVDGQQVGQRLGGVVVAAVTGIDDGHFCHLCGGIGRALLGMAHGDDVGVGADDAHRVADGLAFRCGAAAGLGEAQHTAAQIQHGGFKGEPGAGGGLEEQRRQLFVAAHLLVFFRLSDDVLGYGDQVVDLLRGQICDVDQMSHLHSSFRTYF